jgi:hypothetical protein
MGATDSLAQRTRHDHRVRAERYIVLGNATAIAQNVAAKSTSFADFLEEVLRAENDARRARAREMFAGAAGFPDG